MLTGHDKKFKVEEQQLECIKKIYFQIFFLVITNPYNVYAKLWRPALSMTEFTYWLSAIVNKIIFN